MPKRYKLNFILRAIGSNKKRLNKVFKTIQIPILISSLMLLSGCIIKVFTKISFYSLIIDPSALYKYPSYTGFFSQIGLLLWSATFAISFFSFMILSFSDDAKIVKKFLLSSGLISFFLCMDDAFLFHENNEITFYLIYCIGILIWFLKFYKLILKTEYLILISSIFFFCLSLLLDFGDFFNIPLRAAMEDSFKFLGIVNWLLYFINVGANALAVHVIKKDSFIKKRSSLYRFYF